VEGRGRGLRGGRCGLREGHGRAGGQEENAGAGGGLPAVRRDLNELTLGIGKVEEDAVEVEAGAIACDAAKDGES